MIWITLLVILAVLLFLGLYAWQIEPRWFRVRHLRHELGGETLRILFFSDLHFGKGRSAHIYKRLLEVVRQQNFDLILLGGDYIDADHRYQSACSAFLKELVKIGKPVYAAIGDHDHDHAKIQVSRIRQMLREVKIEILENRRVVVGGYQLIGIADLMSDLGYRRLQKNRRSNRRAKEDTRNYVRSLSWLSEKAAPNRPAIIFGHNPDIVYLSGPEKGALALAGHTHGGQIWPMRWLGSMSWFTVPQGSFGSWSGIRQVGGRQLVVSQGAGSSVLPFRFGTRPEVWVVELS